MNFFSFPRPQLAIAYCDSLEGKGIANARSGLFLAGPRRVGKSTFVKDELIPEALKRDWVQSGRGSYALEDESFAKWFRHRQSP